jgi:hypothetical protein
MSNNELYSCCPWVGRFKPEDNRFDSGNQEYVISHHNVKIFIAYCSVHWPLMLTMHRIRFIGNGKNGVTALLPAVEGLVCESCWCVVRVFAKVNRTLLGPMVEFGFGATCAICVAGEILLDIGRVKDKNDPTLAGRPVLGRACTVRQSETMHDARKTTH